MITPIPQFPQVPTIRTSLPSLLPRRLPQRLQILSSRGRAIRIRNMIIRFLTFPTGPQLTFRTQRDPAFDKYLWNEGRAIRIGTICSGAYGVVFFTFGVVGDSVFGGDKFGDCGTGDGLGAAGEGEIGFVFDGLGVRSVS